MSVWTIVVAAGTASRFGGEVPKQFVEVAGRPMIGWSVRAAVHVSDGVVVVLPAGLVDQDLDLGVTLRDGPAPTLVAGGATRSASVRAGLAAVPVEAEVIVVHDAARPAADVDLFGRVVDRVRAGADAAIPVVAAVDTLRRADGTSVDRSDIQIVQTPQGFAATALRSAHQSQADATDDAGLVAAQGGLVETVAGMRWNFKVTDPDDRSMIEAVLLAKGERV